MLIDAVMLFAQIAVGIIAIGVIAFMLVVTMLAPLAFALLLMAALVTGLDVLIRGQQRALAAGTIGGGPCSVRSGRSRRSDGAGNSPYSH